ncbi:MAP7 domain-containing protein 2 isoform X1 [Drosophila willistoni]|uniref:MAP7 domain-containing protein 2 isoform X1 n=1 Tax=Drosophila willistoni TaxID=7260 RepID=UPI000C26CC5B|nr:MAP7 domain-containing protein 2 isoform X1 [Drosophila willistoni]
MASLGGQHENYSTNPGVENTPQKRPESREGSAERKVSKDREEKLKYARDRQNEERQRKIEELRAQAEAAQRYREQKEEERRRRIEEIRVRDTEKRHQVEERKKAIIEAEKERREYILKKNLERESRIETKKRDRNSIVFAFGSSTPRLLDVPADYGLVSPSAFWGQRRSTSISNVAAGASLSRRSSERELADSGAKKRASSSTDRHDDHRRKSSSMYEVFNWGYSNDEPPKRYSLSIASSEINIDGPAPPNSNSKHITTTAHRQNNNNNSTPITTTTTNAASQHHYNNNNNSNHNSYRKEDIVDTSPIVFRSVYRRKTDLMPTIPSPRDGHYGSRSSLSTTPARTPGRAYSMNRLDQLAQPIRRNGEHVRAILERERRERELEMLDETSSLGGGVGRRNAAGSRSKRAGSAGGSGTNSATGNMSRSMTHLAGTTHRERGKYSLGGGISTSFRPLGSTGQRDSSKSMTQISSSWSTYGTTPTIYNHQYQYHNNHHHHHNHNQPQRQSNLGLQTAATKKYLQSSFASSSASFYSNATRRGGQQQYATSTTNPYRYLDLDPNSLLLMNSSSLLVNAGSRSGNATPGGHFNNSRPGSAMSTSTTMSTSGLVPRRPATAPRKPRPASIAGTGMSLEEINKLKKDQKPPVKTTAASPSAQTTPKRTANLMSTSLIVTSSSSRLSSAEKKTPSKRDSPMVPKAASASKALPNRTASSERISRHAKESKTKDTSAMTRSMIVTNSNSSISSTNTTTITTTTTATTSSTLTPPALASAPAPASETAPYVPDQNGVEKVLAADEIPVDNSADVTVAAVKAPITAVSKAEKEALNSVKTEEVAQQVAQAVEPIATDPIPAAAVSAVTANVEEKADEGTEKEELAAPKPQPPQEQTAPKKPSRSKENSEVRELTPPAPNAGPDGNDLMTASMIAKKITTEEEAKAALAERRRLAREEAERQAELERQRLEAERLAELKAQEEEAERQRLFEEESTRLAEEQRRGEEERLRKAIEEAQQREAEEQQKREEEERQRVEREEAEKKAKEEAEKQRVEVAERLKREEKEREERRKRVEAIMSRTRKGGAAATPSKESNDSSKAAATEGPKEANPTGGSTSSSSESNSGSSNNSTGGSPSTPAVTPSVTADSASEPPNSQAMYEQSVVDKENSLINSFSTMIIDENAKNLQQQQVSNGKLLAEFTTNTPAVANGNGHIENVNNKNDINLLQDTVTPTATQLIDLSIESQQDLHLNNNNSLLTSTAATTTLVTADSHENKDISLL